MWKELIYFGCFFFENSVILLNLFVMLSLLISALFQLHVSRVFFP